MLPGEHRWGAGGGAHSFLHLLVFAADSFFGYNEEGYIMYASALFSSNTFGRLVFAGEGAHVDTERSKREHAERKLFSLGIC